MNSRRSFFKSLAVLGAAAVGCPGVFIPKFEPVKWKAFSMAKPNPNWCTPSEFFGKWNFVETTYRLIGDMWVPDDRIHFTPYPNKPIEIKTPDGMFKTVPILWS